jgi:hypothetical protein
MNNNIPVVTQEEFEPKNQANTRLTMATTDLAKASVPKNPEKKMQQKGLWGRQAITAPGKKDKTKEAKKKPPKQPKHTAYRKEQDDDWLMASYLQSQDRLKYFKDLKDKLKNK